jgi:hypothetical protein
LPVRGCADQGSAADEGHWVEEGVVSDPEEEDFAAMFEASLQTRHLEKGEMIEGTIVAIGPEVALIDVGGKGEAVLSVDELKNAEGEIEGAIGDPIQARPQATGSLKTLFTAACRWKGRSNGK